MPFFPVYESITKGKKMLRDFYICEKQFSCAETETEDTWNTLLWWIFLPLFYKSQNSIMMLFPVQKYSTTVAIFGKNKRNVQNGQLLRVIFTIGASTSDRRQGLNPCCNKMV
jgi:hypothetical protein